ncbi:hypothetical protein EMCRGX_G019228 [Ephydatia muelleri]
MGRREQREREKRKAVAICCTIEQFLLAKKSCTEVSTSAEQGIMFHAAQERRRWMQISKHPAQSSSVKVEVQMSLANHDGSCCDDGCCHYAGVLRHLHVGGTCKRWLHSRQQKGTAAALELPGVSIIKPIVGCDTNLKANLETFFQLSYPKCELLICIAEPDNSPAMSVVRGLVGQYPTITAKVFVGGEIMGVNPKINNMMPAYRQAQYDLIWICDSGIAALPNTLHELVSHMASPEVALVHQPPYVGTHVDSFPALLDKVYFGTQHLRVYLVANYFGQNCANGMSWLIRRTALEGVGGLANFSDYLAEDFTIGKALWTRSVRGLNLEDLLLIFLKKMYQIGYLIYRNYSKIRTPLRLKAYLQNALEAGDEYNASPAEWRGQDTVLIPGTYGEVGFMVFHVGMWLCSDLLLLTIIEGGVVGPWWKVLGAWTLREAWTFILFLEGVWSREVVWRGTSNGCESCSSCLRVPELPRGAPLWLASKKTLRGKRQAL